MKPHVLVVRLDSAGDILLAGPCVRAVAANAGRVTLLAGPRGKVAAELLPGGHRVLEWTAPWIDPDPDPVAPAEAERLIRAIAALAPDMALILTSFHQSALPTALLLRLAGVRWIGAYSQDYPGSLLDLRLTPPGGIPEPERGLRLAAAAGFVLAPGDSGGLAVRHDLPDAARLTGPGPYVVYHPGASVSARMPSSGWSARAVDALATAGHRIVVTGSDGEIALTSQVAGGSALDLGGKTDFPTLAAVLRGARVVVSPNTGTAHLAAAVGRPVVSLFSPVVPAERWAPHGVASVLLGDQHATCRGSRARNCPTLGHPCLDGIEPAEVIAAVHALTQGCTGQASEDLDGTPSGMPTGTTAYTATARRR